MGAHRSDLGGLAAARHRSALDITPPCLHDLREILNALLYLDRTGTQWRYLPHDFPPWQTVYGYFADWQADGVIAHLHGLPHRLAREAAGREGQPSAGAIDTQSVKTSTNVPLSAQGTDVGKRIVGRKRGAITDTTGLLMTLLVPAADASDSAIGLRLLDTAHDHFPRLRKLWADNAFRTTCIEHAARLGIALEVVQRDAGSRGVAPLPRRWAIERTFGWIMTFRRLTRDYETLPARSAALIQLRMVDLMARRLTGESTPTWRGA